MLIQKKNCVTSNCLDDERICKLKTIVCVVVPL